MKKWLSVLVCLFAFIPFVDAADKKEAKKEEKEAKYIFEETVYVPLPEARLNKWVRGTEKADVNKGIAVTRYILETETMKNWTQMLNIQFKDKKHVQVESAEAAMKEEASKSNSLVKLKVLSKNPHDILFERDFPTGEHELARMIMTKKGLHRIAYIKRGPLSDEERTQWVDRLSQGMLGGRDD
jgi:hypothetical protein